MTHITVQPDDPRRHHIGVQVHHDQLADDEMTSCEGIPVTSALRTVQDQLNHAKSVWGVCAVESAVRLGLTEVSAVTALSGLSPGARTALELVDVRSESALETYGRLLLVEAGLAPDHLQYVIPGGLDDLEVRVDLVWLGPDGRVLLVVEFDGRAAHNGDDAVLRDKRRDHLLNDLRIPWRRFGWRDVLSGRVAMVEDVRRCLARAAA